MRYIPVCIDQAPDGGTLFIGIEDETEITREGMGG